MEHFSDSHGILPKFSDDILICSGDLMPNGPDRACREPSKRYQEEWIRSNGKAFSGKRLIYSAGNHDFIDPCIGLRSFGCEAINITNKLMEIDGIKYYGFPYVPYLAGEWEWEVTKREMLDQVEMIRFPVDILVTHSPVFPSGSNRIENTVLANYLTFAISQLPRLILCGHDHESAGIIDEIGIKQINSACMIRRIDQWV